MRFVNNITASRKDWMGGKICMFWCVEYLANLSNFAIR